MGPRFGASAESGTFVIASASNWKGEFDPKRIAISVYEVMQTRSIP